MFKPMLAPHQDPMSYPKYFDELKFPLMCSPKYDGIRCIISGKTAYSRTWKPIPSTQVQEAFANDDCEGLDGELIDGNPTDFGVYNRTQSIVMSKDKIGDINFYAFDYVLDDWVDKPFSERYNELRWGDDFPNVKLVPQILVRSLDQLLAFEAECLEAGYEGIMMKSPDGRYKCGRGTWKEGLIYKLKRFQDDEGIVVDFVEQMSNCNTQEINELGYSKRSTKKEGMVPAGCLGKFIVDFNGVIIEVAPGIFTYQMKRYIWNHKEQFRGKFLKFRHFTHGVKDKPRFPRAVGFRDKMDM